MTNNEQNTKVSPVYTEPNAVLTVETPAVVGSCFYEVRYFDSEGDWVIGRFTDKKASFLALANWIIQEWAVIGNFPWKYASMDPRMSEVDNSDYPETTYLKLFTPTETIDTYFAGTHDGYTVERYLIEETPESPFTVQVIERKK